MDQTKYTRFGKTQLRKNETRSIDYKNIKKINKKDVEELLWDQFITMLQKLKAEKKEYRGFTR